MMKDETMMDVESSLGDAHSLPPAPPDGRKKRPFCSRHRVAAVVGIVILMAAIVGGISLGVLRKGTTSEASTSSSTSGSTSSTASSSSSNSTSTNENVTTPTATTTSEPTPAPIDSLADWLVHQEIAKREDFSLLSISSSTSNLSYQSKALAWLKSMNTTIPTTDYQVLVNNPAYNVTVQYALACLYYATNPWVSKVGFLTSTQPCEWQSRNFLGDILGVRCDDDGLPVSLKLDFNGLKGPIVPELGLLWSLKGIDLEQNRLTGTIPHSLQELPLLSTLFLNDNRLNGPLPPKLGQNGLFRGITVSNNQNLTGPLPAQLIQSAGTLRILAVDDNQLTGNIQFLTPFVNLTHVFLEDNRFTGTLSADFMVDAQVLRILDLSDNRLDGDVPSHLFGLSNLETLDLHGNQFQRLPETFPINGKLKFLALHQCQLEGPVPVGIANLQSLSHLDLSQNKLTGPLPTNLPPQLTYLFLAENNFDSGIIPQTYGALSNLRELSLKSTQRTGVLPSFVATDLPNLILLDLDNNALRGNIPQFLGNQTEDLYALLLNNNLLTGPVPSSLGTLPSLSLFFVDNNSVSGSMSLSLCSLPQFSVNATDRLPLAADCGEVNCDCCTICCVDGGAECHDNDIVPSIDPQWERDYRRPVFQFGNDTVLGPA